MQRRTGAQVRCIRPPHVHSLRATGRSQPWARSQSRRCTRRWCRSDTRQGGGRDRQRAGRQEQTARRVGNGSAESDCKQIATQRLKRAGARWTKEGARATAKARSAWLSGEWDTLCAQLPLPKKNICAHPEVASRIALFQNKLNCSGGCSAEASVPLSACSCAMKPGSCWKSWCNIGRYLGWCSAAAGWNIGTTMRAPMRIG